MKTLPLEKRALPLPPCRAVFRDFPSLRPSLEQLLDLLPRIAPRQFSIASSRLARPGKLQLLVAMVNFTTPIKRTRRGAPHATGPPLGPARRPVLRCRGRPRGHSALFTQRRVCVVCALSSRLGVPGLGLHDACPLPSRGMVFTKERENTGSCPSLHPYESHHACAAPNPSSTPFFEPFERSGDALL